MNYLHLGRSTDKLYLNRGTMTNFAVLGLGLMGEGIMYDLLNNTDSNVFGFELIDSRRDELEKKYSDFGTRLKIEKLDLDMTIAVEKNNLLVRFQELDIQVTFGAIDYKFNEYLTKLCIEAGSSFLDLGGNPDVVRAQQKMDESAKSRGVIIIPDCGLAPGMANIIAAHGMDQFEELESCHIRVGGLPQDPETILNYQQVFAIRGLTNEYLEDALVIRGGKIEKVSSLTEIEELSMPHPFEKLEAFQTSGGTSNLPELYEGKINELTYKTIRYPGHCQFIQFLKEFELLSSTPYPLNGNINPRAVVEYYLQKNLPRDNPDLVLIKIWINGQGNDFSKLTFELIDRYDPESGFSSMARTTAFPISILGIMISNKQIDTKGVLAGEEVTPKELFLTELAKRNIIFNISKS